MYSGLPDGPKNYTITLSLRDRTSNEEECEFERNGTLGSGDWGY